jgi:deazaflavin-dependent oxidoreductase (nitroreductase family)
VAEAFPDLLLLARIVRAAIRTFGSSWYRAACARLEAVPRGGQLMDRTHSLDRWLYRGKRPNRIARLVNGASARLAAGGIGPDRLVMLEVVGRRTAKPVRFPVVVADHKGERYLVSMLGDDTSWVRNVRAADGRAVIRHRQREVVRLAEVDAGERAAILRRYLECSPGARSHIEVDHGAPLRDFERIAPQYPVFRVTAVDAGRR